MRDAQFLELVEIDPGMITVVIGERDVGQSALARALDPRLKEALRVRLDAVALRMAVVIGEEFHAIGGRRSAASLPSRRGQKFLPNAQLGILRNENLADENFVR